MYRLIGVLKGNGKRVTMARSDDYDELTEILKKVSVEMCDPTVSKYVLEHGTSVTLVKEIAHAYIVEGEE